MPQDAVLSISKALPAAAANNTTDGLDLSAVGGYSDMWRLGYILVSVPALANHTDSTKTITLDMYVAPPGVTGVWPPIPGSYAVTSPLIEVQVPGVASTGSLATTVKVPIPPGTVGFIRFLQTVPSGDGNNTASSVTYTWVFE
jgi:hypothetical protein